MGDLPISGIGTPILVILAVLSVVSIAIIIMKAMRLSGAVKGADRRAIALQSLQDNDIDAAKTRLGTPSTPADRVIGEALKNIAEHTADGLETRLEIAGNAEARAAFSHIRTLETIAMISPLLGLLGTVLGMIQAFRRCLIA